MFTRLLRRASIGALALTLIGATAAVADDISNNLDSSVDATAEVMSLNVGGSAGSTILAVVPVNGDGKNGCNLTGSTTLSVAVATSNTAVATVSPSSVTFTSCSDTGKLTVTPLAIGSATISLTQTSNNTGGSFNLAPATFTVNVGGPSNTAPVVTVTGVKLGDAYPYGSVPTAGCTVNDAEDGQPTVTPTLSAITGPNASDGLGSQTATCSYTDKGGLTSTVNATYTIVKAASVVAVTCDPTNVTYTGGEQTPCAAIVTGSGGLNAPVTVSYSNNVVAGTATATASFNGDATHLASTGSATFTIGQASSTVTVTCPAAVPWTGTALTPCTAKATGAGGLDVALTPTYSANTGIGTATASASYAGDDNHTGSSNSATFTIDKAATNVTVTCPSSATYTGSAIEPCTAEVTGAGGLKEDLTVTYAHNINAGTATASAEYVGDDNHAAGSGSATFTIDKAASAVTVTCPPSNVTYTGSALEPCTAAATGAGGLNQDLTITYADNTNAGTATASASYGGDANHDGSTGSTTFTIDKAASAVTVTCPPTVTFTGSALEPCTAAATGAGGLNQDLTITYADNTNAGTATASASYGGDANHDGSTGSTTFTIERAPSTVTVTCPPTVTFTGSAIEPCTAKVTGAGGLDQAVTVTYTDNVYVGTATASATYAGDANHLGDTGSATFAIDKAPSTVTVTCNPSSVTFTGSPIEPCTAKATGVGGLDTSASVSYANNVGVGTATATGTYAGDANHVGSTGSGTFTIGSWTPSGFYQPVDMGSTFNTVKNGSTVPLKFEVFRDGVELTSTAIVSSFTATTIACDTSAVTDAIEFTTTGGTSLRYDTTAGQFVQNWQTPKKPGTCYLVTMTTQDKSTVKARFQLK